jgi:hypothetical protein
MTVLTFLGTVYKHNKRFLNYELLSLAKEEIVGRANSTFYPTIGNRFMLVNVTGFS